MLTGFVLAGGKSSRMGSDKALIELRPGATLLSRAIDTVRSACEQVFVVGKRDSLPAGIGVVEDIHRDCGPLGGIHAALTHSATELNLVLAVDMPFVPPEFLRYLAAAAAESGATVTLPRTADRSQPLCAVYGRGFLAIAESALQQGQYKIEALFEHMPLRVIGDDELRAHGFGSQMFANVNSPADLERARAVRQ